jgi:hypothetical protein
MIEHQLTLTDYLAAKPHFNGADYDDHKDRQRLVGQIWRIYNCMKDGKWRTLNEIAFITGDPHASISAQLRNLRKPRFGNHIVERRNRGLGLFEYRLLIQSINK